MASKLYEKPQTRRNFFIPDHLYDALQAKARETGVPMSQHVRDALAAYLEMDHGYLDRQENGG